MKTTQEVLSYWLGRKYRETEYYGYQCVAWVKKFAEERFDTKLGTFGGSAFLGWQNTYDTFLPSLWDKVEYTGEETPPEDAIVFWGPSNLNKYGHVAIAGKPVDGKVITIIEQNGKNGLAKGTDGDEIRKVTITPDGRGKLLGWFIFKSPNPFDTMKVGSDNNYEAILAEAINGGFEPFFQEHKGNNVLTEKETKELLDILASRIEKRLKTYIDEALKKNV